MPAGDDEASRPSILRECTLPATVAPERIDPALLAAFDAEQSYTSMRITKLDARRLALASASVEYDADSRRAFIRWLLDTHPDIDSAELERELLASLEGDADSTVR